MNKFLNKEITMKIWHWSLMVIALGMLGQAMAPTFQRTFEPHNPAEYGPSLGTLWQEAETLSGDVNVFHWDIGWSEYRAVLHIAVPDADNDIEVEGRAQSPEAALAIAIAKAKPIKERVRE